MSTDTLLRKKEMLKMVGLSYPTVWRMMGNGVFPQKFKISEKRVGWSLNEVEAWMQTRMDERVTVQNVVGV